MRSLAAIARETTTLRLGTGVVVLPLNHPLRVAEDFAMLDLMSDGRVDLGIGRGYQPLEFSRYGVPQTDTRRMFDEGIQVILQAWTQEQVNFHGTYYQFTAVPVCPKPLQQPHPPIWMACLSPETFALAGRYGFHLLYGTVFGLSPEKAQSRLHDYSRGLREGGHDPATRRRAALMMIYVADSVEQARQEFAEPVMWYYRTIAKYIAPPQGEAPIPSYEMYVQTRDLAASASWDELLRRKAVVCGNADDVVEELTRAQEIYGFTDLLCWTRLGGLDHRKVLRSMELMHTKVFPHLRPLSPRALAA